MIMKPCFLMIAALLIVAASRCPQDFKGCLTCDFADACGTCNTIDGYMPQAASNGRCSCAMGFFRDASLYYCDYCALQFPNCGVCNITTCYSCLNNITINNGSCEHPCEASTQIPGCVGCQGNGTCNDCSGSRNLTLSSDQQSCDCKVGFVRERAADSFCIPCNWEIPGCATCTTISQCLTCETSGNFVSNGNGSCVCRSGYYIWKEQNWAEVSRCSPCVQSNCTSCSSATKCDACQNGYTLILQSNGSTTCQACSVTLTGCTSCNSTSVCTQCNNASGFSLSNFQCQCPSSNYLNDQNSCQPCNQWGSQCQTCTRLGCTQCPTNYVVNGTTCRQLCSITRCLLCYNSTACSLCAPFSGLSANRGACNCDVGYIADATSTSCVAAPPQPEPAPDFESMTKMALVVVITVLFSVMI